MTINFTQKKKKAVKYASLVGFDGGIIPVPPNYLGGDVPPPPPELSEAEYHAKMLQKVDALVAGETASAAPPKHPMLGMLGSTYYYDMLVYTAEAGLSMRCREVFSTCGTFEIEQAFSNWVAKWSAWLKEGKKRRVAITVHKIHPQLSGKELEVYNTDYWEATSPQEKVYVNGPKANYKKENPSA